MKYRSKCVAFVTYAAPHMEASDGDVLSNKGIIMVDAGDINVPGQCTNVACTFNIFPPTAADGDGDVAAATNRLDLSSVAVTCREMGADYNTRRFAPCFFRMSRAARLRKFLRETSIYDPICNDDEAIKLLSQNVVVFLFSYGKAVVIGAKDFYSSMAMAYHFSAVFSHYHKTPAGVYGFELNNMVFSFELPFSLNLASLLEFPELAHRISYNPDNFPMACIRPDKIRQRQKEQEAGIAHTNVGNNVTIMMSVGGSVIITGSRSMDQAVNALLGVMPYFREVEASKGQLAPCDMPMQMIRNRHIRLAEYSDIVWGKASTLLSGPSEAYQRRIMCATDDDSEHGQDLHRIAVVEAMREGIRRMRERGELEGGATASSASTTKAKANTKKRTKSTKSTPRKRVRP